MMLQHDIFVPGAKGTLVFIPDDEQGNKKGGALRVLSPRPLSLYLVAVALVKVQAQITIIEGK